MTTPNHPEYPSAHGSITSAVAEVFTTFLGTNQINLHIHGFDPAGPPAGEFGPSTFFRREDYYENNV
jgi:hypothetical protein